MVVTCSWLISCTEIYFTEPQPKGVKVIPNGLEELAGEYINVEDTDTLKVSKEGVLWTEDEDEAETLGKEILVKKYKGRYFVNFLNSEKNLWQLFVVEKKDPDQIYVTNLTSVDEDNIQEFNDKKYCTLIEKEGSDDKYLVLSPSKRQLLKLLGNPVFDQNKINLNKLNSD